jgi:hypothetical protein
MIRVEYFTDSVAFGQFKVRLVKVFGITIFKAVL